MPIYADSVYNEDEKSEMGKKLTFYLEEFLFHNQLSVNDGAKFLNMTPIKFTQLKNGHGQGRYQSSMDYLKSLAQLQKMELSEFVALMEGKSTSEATKKSKKELYAWDVIVFKALEGAPLVYRKNFVDVLNKLTGKKEGKLVGLLCRIGAAAGKFGEASMEGIALMLERLWQEKKD